MQNNIQWLETIDISKLQVLFNEIFGTQITQEFLKWKYRDAKHLGTAIEKDEQLLSYYGGMPRDVFYRRKIIHAVQIGDVMVHPNQRGAFTRKGAFYKMADAYIEKKIGFQKEYSLAFGFPSQRAYKLGKCLGFYDVVDSLVELEWGSGKKKYLGFWSYREVKNLDENSVSKLWEDMKYSLKESIVGVRNFKWINERYLKHPQNTYKVLTIKRVWNKNIKAIIFLKEHEDGSLEWMDMIGNVADLPLMWTIAYHYMSQYGFKKLFCWITKSQVDFFKASNPIVHDIDIVIPFIVKNAVMNIKNIKNHWWLMSGDIDFK